MTVAWALCWELWAPQRWLLRVTAVYVVLVIILGQMLPESVVAWLLLHLYYLIGHRNRIAAMFAWGISFLGRTRGQMAITSQMMYARPVVDWVEKQAQEGTLAAVERIEAAEKQAG